jgi:hypothetical protein
MAREIFNSKGQDMVRLKKQHSNWRHNNSRFNHLHNRRDESEVNDPISLGMEPVCALETSAFGDKK